jgi:predicted ATP-grasp superfamily ATP-dependent carboligase
MTRTGKGSQAPVVNKKVLIHEWVTGGGLAGTEMVPSWASEGGAMRRAVARDFINVPWLDVIVTHDERFYHDYGPWSCVRIGPGEEVDRLTALAPEVDYIVLIAPETGGVLFERTVALTKFRAQFLGSSAEAVRLTTDKYQLARHFSEQGIATPETLRIRPADGLPRDFPYPAVLKPIDGAGSLATFFVPRYDQYPRDAFTLDEAILQPYFRGEPLSASFLVHRGGKAELVAIGHQRIEVHNGRFRYLGGTLPARRDFDDGQPQRAVQSVAGLRGFVGVDYLWDHASKRATVLEINPRPTTSYVGLVRLLPKGLLARRWLDAVGTVSREWSEFAGPMGREHPLSFDADGTINRFAAGVSPS